MSIQDLIRLARRRIVTILICVLTGVVLAAAALSLTPKSYTATATAYVSVRVAESDTMNTGNYFSASQLANQKAQAFAAVLTSTAVAEDVAQRLGRDETPSELASRVLARAVPNTSTITVSVRAFSADDARNIADSVVEVASTHVKKLDGYSSPVTLALLSSAWLADVTTSPSSIRMLALGLFGGLVVGFGLAFLKSLLDRRLRVSEDIEQVTNIPIVALVPQANAIGRETLAKAEKDFESEEALRKLRTNLKFTSVDEELKACVISSPNPAEGKSSIALQLAQVMAAAGEDVVLIDADLRRPTIDKVLHVDGSLGLSQVLAGSVTLDQALHKSTQPGLFVLPAGQIPPNPSELLGSQKMAELVDTLSKELFVILDAPPLLPVTDAAVLSRIASGVLLVVRSGKTKTDELETALEHVARVEGKIVGIVLNGVLASKGARFKYGNKAYYTSHYEPLVAEQGSDSRFDIRAHGEDGKALAEHIKSFDEVLLAEQVTSPQRRSPSFRPIRSHVEHQES